MIPDTLDRQSKFDYSDGMNTIPVTLTSKTSISAAVGMDVNPNERRMYLAARVSPGIRHSGEFLAFFGILMATGVLLGLPVSVSVTLSFLGSTGAFIFSQAFLARRGFYPFAAWDDVFHSILVGMTMPDSLQAVHEAQQTMSGQQIERKIGQDDTLAMVALTHRIVQERRRGARKVELTGESSELLSRVLEGLRKPEPERIALV